MSQAGDAAKAGRTFWVLLAASLLLWQVGQALMIGKFGVPGLFEIPVSGLAGSRDGPGQGGESVARKTPDKGGGAHVPRSPEGPASSPPAAAPGAASAVTVSELEDWVRAEAREFVGGMDEDGNMLYRFDVWLDIPAETNSRIAMVAYAFDAPSAKPPKQSSKDGQNGYRVSFGGLTCATSIAFTVTFDDGRSQSATVDGCEVLN